MSDIEAIAEADMVKNELGISKTLDERIAKVFSNQYQYATAGDSRAFLHEIERLRDALAEVHLTINALYTERDKARAALAEAQRDLKSECERRDEIIASTTKLWKDAEAENTRLRAALANSQSPCVYCSLPADEWAKCQSGFPGCARADDAMGCPHLGSSLENIDLRAALAEARELLGAFYRADIDPHKYDRTAQWLERNP